MKNRFDFDKVRQRLKESLDAQKVSMRQASLDSGNGPGYVHSIIKGGQEPSITNLAKVCDAAGVSLSYVLYGLELSPETETIISLLEKNPEKRDGILALLSS